MNKDGHLIGTIHVVNIRKGIGWRKLPLTGDPFCMKKTNKTIKKSYLLHTFLMYFIEADLKFASESISLKIRRPIREVKKTIKPLIQMLFIHLCCELLLKEKKDEMLFNEFLERIGKKEKQVKELYKIFGDYNIKNDEKETISEHNFYIQLQSELDIESLNETEQASFFLIYHKIFCSCQFLINELDKLEKEVELKNGKFDYK